MPSYFIYSMNYTVLQERDLKCLKRKFINTKFIPFDGGHLFPLEKPLETAQLIKKLITI